MCRRRRQRSATSVRRKRMSTFVEHAMHSLRNTLGQCTATVALCAVGAVATLAVAKDSADDPANHAWQAGAIAHAQRMRAFFDRNSNQQATPSVIPSFETDTDPSGSIATTQLGGATQASQNAFFANLGTTNRTCFTCHQ